MHSTCYFTWIRIISVISSGRPTSSFRRTIPTCDLRFSPLQHITTDIKIINNCTKSIFYVHSRVSSTIALLPNRKYIFLSPFPAGSPRMKFTRRSLPSPKIIRFTTGYNLQQVPLVAVSVSSPRAHNFRTFIGVWSIEKTERKTKAVCACDQRKLRLQFGCCFFVFFFLLH